MIVKNVEKKENNTAIFQVETDKAEFESAVNKAYLKAKRDIYIPGFRKGKAPRAVVEGMYGAEVFYQDACDELAPEAFEFGLNESGLKIVGAPAISDLNVSDERTAVFTFAVSLYPEVELGQYKGIEAPKAVVEVTDEQVDSELQAVARRNSRKVSVDDRPAQMGDTANIDFDGYLEGVPFDGGKGEGYDLELGSGSFVPGFEEQVVGMSIGEEKDLDITFPENYVEDLAGKAVVFKVKLNSISFNELPELDDEFAKDVSEFDTLDEYKADLRANIVKRNEEQAENAFRSEIIAKACENMTVTIPQVMITDKAEEIIRSYAANFGMSDRNMPLDQLLQMMGLSQEAFEMSIVPSAEQQVKSELLLEAVAAAEGIELTEDEQDAYIAKIAENVGATSEDILKYFGLEYIKAEYKKEKASALIFDSAVVGEAKAEEAAEEEKPAKKTGTRKTKAAEAEEAPKAEESAE